MNALADPIMIIRRMPSPRNPPLQRDCEALQFKGHNPQQVIDLSRKLNFQALLDLAFPNVPSFVRMHLFSGNATVLLSATGDWDIAQREL